MNFRKSALTGLLAASLAGCSAPQYRESSVLLLYQSESGYRTLHLDEGQFRGYVDSLGNTVSGGGGTVTGGGGTVSGGGLTVSTLLLYNEGNGYKILSFKDFLRYLKEK